jgi:hypothetical protein
VLELRLKNIVGKNKLQGIWKCTLTVCKHAGLSFIEGVLKTNLHQHNTSTKLSKMFTALKFEEIFIIIDNKILLSHILCMLSYESCTIKILILSPRQKIIILNFFVYNLSSPKEKVATSTYVPNM